MASGCSLFRSTSTMSTTSTETKPQTSPPLHGAHWPQHISSSIAAACRRIREREETPHRCLSASTWAKEEDGVVAGLRDGAGDEVLELAARPKQILIGEAVY
jgi:hypothetical protein